MLRSMYSGVSGLRSHQTMVDVIGNNIANVNTVGYKSSSVVFQDLLSQRITGAGLATEAAGGTNPAQVGLGVKVAGVSVAHTQGAAQLTGKSTDLSIQGDGYFAVRNPVSEILYTRAGSLDFDAFGRLVAAGGNVLQGWTATGSGVMNTNATPGDITMPLGQQIEPAATTEIQVGGNLDAGAAPGTAVTTSIEIYNTQGLARILTVEFVKTATPNQWDVQASADWDKDGTPDPVAVSGSPMVFDPLTGQVSSGPVSIDPGAAQGYAGPIVLDHGEPNEAGALVQFAGSNGGAALRQNGYPLGVLQTFTIGADGMVTGVFSNGSNRPLAQIAMASFTNPAGLERAGDSAFRQTVNSGNAQIGVAGSGGRGTVLGATLEMSNVDLAREFTNLIVAQRGYQANSRVITSSDELLQELVNLKR